jgi:twinkle protein
MSGGLDWTVIEDRLKEQAEAVCKKLLPNGRQEGAEWVCGSVEGQEGRSLKVNLAGKVGIWRDFAGDKGGNSLIGLWCTVRGKPFRDCIIEAKQFLGIPDDYEERFKSYGQATGAGAQPRPQREDSAWKAVAEVWAQCQPLTEGGPVWEYLVTQRRIEPPVLAWYDVREMLSFGRWVMVFPYFLPEEEEDQALRQLVSEGVAGTAARAIPAWLKFEALDRPAGKKREWTTKAPEKCLWGMQVSHLSAFKDARHVLIAEGEKDALSWASFACQRWSVLPLSVPFGAKWRGSVKGQPSPNREWLDRCWEWLHGFETVFVAMDSDEAGRRAAADIIAEIGPRRCRLVELPEKPKAA